MRELNIQRDRLYDLCNHLKKLKFSPEISQELSFKLNAQEKMIYQKYLFYRNYIKEGGKINAEKRIC